MPTDPNTIRSYSENAEMYNAHVSDPNNSPYHWFYEKPAIRAELPSLDGLEVISIGCGSGVDAQWLADNGANKVVGVDVSRGLIDIAKANHPAVEFFEMDMEHLDFPDESFDIAYSSLAIHYLDNWTPSLKEARRILKPGGKYVFSCGHPIESAIEYTTEDNVKYARLGREKGTATGKQTLYGDYLARDGDGVKQIDGVLGNFEVTAYHRTFSTMLQQILASGFTIERAVEPQPTEEMKKVDPNAYEQLTKLPVFIIWVLSK